MEIKLNEYSSSKKLPSTPVCNQVLASTRGSPRCKKNTQQSARPSHFPQQHRQIKINRQLLYCQYVIIITQFTVNFTYERTHTQTMLRTPA